MMNIRKAWSRFRHYIRDLGTTFQKGREEYEESRREHPEYFFDEDTKYMW